MTGTIGDFAKAAAAAESMRQARIRLGPSDAKAEFKRATRAARASSA
jgi:hypothetical protein